MLFRFGLSSAWPVPAPKDNSMTDEDLVMLAREAALKAYAPYSRFHVGCAIESTGGEVVTGGTPKEGEGFFYIPTLLSVGKDNPILSQEIFGPVAPVTTFATEQEAIELANASQYGLASYIYTKDVNTMFRVSEQIEFGLVGFNAGVISNASAPFGGVKQSGLGREGGAEGIEEYTTVQYIGIADPYAAKK